MGNEKQKTATQVTSGLIEVGIVVVDKLSPVHLEAVNAARNQIEQWLHAHYGEFQWQIALLRREEVPLKARQEPSSLLREGSALRDAEGWDFAVLITATDLIARYKPYSLAATSSALDLSVISTKRIDPQPYAANSEEAQRVATIESRLTTLTLHALCHMNGLPESADTNNLMYQPDRVRALDDMAEFDEQQLNAVRDNLKEVADLRLEETSAAAKFSLLRFYLHSAWINRHEIYSSTVHAKPWEFPIRLMRLSAAATSAILVLKTTAETWELAAQQSVATLSLFLCFVIAGATNFVAQRQGLFVHRLGRQRSEQTVITNITAALIVLLGMITTAALLMLFGALLSLLLYPEPLISSWVGSNAVHWRHYLQANLIVTTLGILIGALGASFEDQHHFRHVVFVDEEI